jgi:hypothetical protein
MENEDLIESNTESYEPKAEPTVTLHSLIVPFVLSATLAFGGGYLLHGNLDGGSDHAAHAGDQLAIEQTKLQKTVIDSQEAQQKRFFDVQMRVVTDCEAKGNIPVFLGGGNVDCKVAPR